jgi:manganese/zinc/iron transport system substrate-binding protein
MLNKTLVSLIASSIIHMFAATSSYATKGTIVTTTGMIADAVKNIVKDNFNVIPLMGPGVDPHAYKATAGDLDKLKKADIIFYNGLHLEGKMDYIFKKLAKVRKVYPISNAIHPDELIRDPDFELGIDPHIWFDVTLWQKVILYISNIMQQHDHTNAQQYKDNATLYIHKLQALDERIKEEIETIPVQN